MAGSRRSNQRKREHAQETTESDSAESAPVKKVRWDPEEDNEREERDMEEPATEPDDDAQQLCIAVTCTGYMLIWASVR